MFTLYILPTPDEGIFSKAQVTPTGYSCLDNKFSISLEFNRKMGRGLFVGLLVLHKLNVRSLSREIWSVWCVWLE